MAKHPLTPFFVAFALLVSPVAYAKNPESEAFALYQDSVRRPAQALAELQAQASINPYAAYFVGLMLEQGRTANGQPNPTDALSYYISAAISVPEAAFNAGALLYRSRKIDEALYYFVQAAGPRLDGSHKAMVLLGRIYEQGSSSFGKSYESALRWYQAGANMRDPTAIGKVGEFFLRGMGCIRNLREARIYLQRAAGMWNPDAQFLLGDMYASGIGAPRDHVEAAMWFMITRSRSQARNGDINSYGLHLTSSGRDMAQKKADLWIAAHPYWAPVDYLAPLVRGR